jgi:hypothetical protein
MVDPPRHTSIDAESVKKKVPVVPSGNLVRGGSDVGASRLLAAHERYQRRQSLWADLRISPSPAAASRGLRAVEAEPAFVPDSPVRRMALAAEARAPDWRARD